MKTILIVAALSEEVDSRFDEFIKDIEIPVLITGMGKLNAATALNQLISDIKLKKTDMDMPDLIINIGSAGSPVWDAGLVVQVDQFIERDLDLAALDEHWLSRTLYPSYLFSSIGQSPCGTGDSFVEAGHFNEQRPYSIVDMEAYALAKVAHLCGIPFMALKYISDAGSIEEWKASMPACRAALFEAFEKVIDQLI